MQCTIHVELEHGGYVYIAFLHGTVHHWEVTVNYYTILDVQRLVDEILNAKGPIRVDGSKRKYEMQLDRLQFCMKHSTGTNMYLKIESTIKYLTTLLEAANDGFVTFNDGLVALNDD
jgi:hypothetical protein